MAERFEIAWPEIGVGGSPALDFVNTLDWRLRKQPVELLLTFADLARWARSAGILDALQARGLRAWAALHPRAALRALASAIEVREAMASVFQSAARHGVLPSRPLVRLESACHRALAGRMLRAAGGAVAWDWSARSPLSERPALAVALDAVRLLTSDDISRVRECGDNQCGWLFLDTSRNRNRRWCTMRVCGNRNKARSFYRRGKNRAADPGR